MDRRCSEMPKTRLARLDYYDIRKIFPDESRDFSAWLGENLELLGDALGIDLDLLGREVPIGDFFADLVVQEIGRDRRLVIECQLSSTDHDHLGKALVYAAGLGARGVVWIATRFRDEHRRVFSWLNEQTAEELNFFAVEFALVRIENSSPAPMFRPVVLPDGWSGTARGTSTGERGRAYAQFWEAVLDPLRKAGFTTARKFSNSNWFVLSGGISEGWIELAFTRNGYRIAYELRTDPPEIARRAMGVLREMAGESLSSRDWTVEENRKYPRMAKYYPETVSIVECGDEARRKMIRWTVDTVREIRSLFSPEVVRKALEKARPEP